MRVTLGSALLLSLLFIDATLGKALPARRKTAFEGCCGSTLAQKRANPWRNLDDSSPSDNLNDELTFNPWTTTQSPGDRNDVPDDHEQDPNPWDDVRTNDPDEKAPENRPDDSSPPDPIDQFIDPGPRTPADQVLLHRQKGRELREELEAAVRAGPSSRDREDDHPNKLSDAGYQGQADKKDTSASGVSPWSKEEFGVDMTSLTWRRDSIIHRNPGPNDQPTVVMYSDPKQGTIVNEYTFRDQDRIKTAQTTQIVMANWREATKDKGVSVQDWKYMFRQNVISEDRNSNLRDGTPITINTHDAMNEAFVMMDRRTFGSRQTTLTLRKDGTGKEAEAFELMSAQSHVRMAYHMCRDYHNELRGLMVLAIHLLHPDHKDASASRHIVIELGR